ncbi:unnamed protein product [Effrenium voratum]|nr:unnamed protein product [Effrenium voratum]
MPKRKASALKNQNQDLQPSLLHTLPRPSEPDQQPAWAAKVRERLALLEAHLRRLQGEKQSLLSLLYDAPEELNQDIWGGENGDGAGVCSAPGAQMDTLWHAAQGCPSDMLSSLDGTSVHPALTAQEPRLPDIGTGTAEAGRVSLDTSPDLAGKASAPEVAVVESMEVARERSERHIEAPVAPELSAPEEPELPAEPCRSPSVASMASTILLSSSDEAAPQQCPQAEALPDAPEAPHLRRWSRGLLSPSGEMGKVSTSPSHPPGDRPSMGLRERLQRRNSVPNDLCQDDLLAPLRGGPSQQATAREVPNAAAAPSTPCAEGAPSALSASGATNSPTGTRGPSADKEAGLRPEELTEEELKTWMLFFGLKPTASRDFMIRRIHEIVDYLDGGTAFLRSICEAPTPARKARAPASQKSPRPKGSPRPKASPKASQSQQSPKRTLTDRRLEMAVEAIRKDKDLYEALLAFEHLDIGEVKRRIVAITPELRSLGEQRLRSYLDSQGFAIGNAPIANAQ